MPAQFTDGGQGCACMLEAAARRRCQGAVSTVRPEVEATLVSVSSALMSSLGLSSCSSARTDSERLTRSFGQEKERLTRSFGQEKAPKFNKLGSIAESSEPHFGATEAFPTERSKYVKHQSVSFYLKTHLMWVEAQVERVFKDGWVEITYGASQSSCRLSLEEQAELLTTCV